MNTDIRIPVEDFTDEIEVKNWIREVLAIDFPIEDIRYLDKLSSNQHFRFNLVGNKSSFLKNQSILNKFVKYGLYNYTNYMYLDFYKGTPTLYLQYYRSNKHLEDRYDGWGTVDLIYQILLLTVFSNKIERGDT